MLEAVRSAAWCRIIPPEDFGMRPIERVHETAYLSFLQRAAQVGEGVEELIHPYAFAPRQSLRIPHSLPGLMGYYSFGAYTPILIGTWEAAYWSAQIASTAARALTQHGNHVYALCRPPGHHAGAALFGGYCYLNNAAIAARELQQLESGARIAILDTDYHHGNGTQLIFYQDPSVLYCSLHAHPDDDYPYYWGDADERGSGEGEGTNINWPLPQGTDDAQYLHTLEAALLDSEAFDPDFMIVSAGLDIVRGDPEGGFNISLDGLRRIGNLLAEAKRRTLVIQEGGYLLETLGQNLLALLEGMG
jgi:acetoin utilization deacetylase AcuC-like enzyme